MSAALIAAGLATSSTAAVAQTRGTGENPKQRYPLLDQNMSVGKAANWNAYRDPAGHPWMQPIRVDLPSTGKVVVLQRPPAPGAAFHAPGQVGLMTGHTYRLKVSDMPEYPGVDLYPSVEILDRMHPPPGLEHNFPVPLEITRDEIDLALEGRLVTKVIYLEQPAVAAPGTTEKPLNVAVYPGHVNLLTESDRAGRPILLIRIGGRVPDANGGDLGYYGTGGPVTPSIPKPRPVKPKPPIPAPAPATESEESTGDVESTSVVRPAAGRTSLQSGSVFGSGTKDEPGVNRLRARGWVQPGGAVRP